MDADPFHLVAGEIARSFGCLKTNETGLGIPVIFPAISSFPKLLLSFEYIDIYIYLFIYNVI